MEDFEGESRYAHYNHFRIGDESTKYKLAVGDYNGDAGRKFFSLPKSLPSSQTHQNTHNYVVLQHVKVLHRNRNFKISAVGELD